MHGWSEMGGKIPIPLALPLRGVVTPLSKSWEEAAAWSSRTLEARRLVARLLRITDITNMPPSARPDAALFIVASDDQYVPWVKAVVSQWRTVRDSLWRGSTVRVLRGGHVSGSLFHSRTYTACILECIARIQRKP